MFRRFALLFAICLLSSLNVAQTPSSPDQPETIFVDGVQYEPYVEEIPTAADTALTVIDWQTDRFKIRERVGAPWQEFEKPAEFDDLGCLEPRSDGTWLVYEGNCPNNYVFSSPESVRILDVESGEYSKPEVVCDSQLKSLPGEGYWAYKVDNEAETASLCFTENGETLGELPKIVDDVEVGWMNFHPEDGKRSLPFISPKKGYLVLRAYPIERSESNGQEYFSFRGDIFFYSFNLRTQQLISIGTIEKRDYADITVDWGQWVSDTRGTLISYDHRASLGTGYYGFDVTQSNSIEPVLRGYEGKSQTTYFDEEAKRYESVLSYYQVADESGGGTNYFPCKLNTYDANGDREYELGDYCVLLPVESDYQDKYTNAYRFGNRYYYLSVEEGTERFSRLEYFDLTTMTRQKTNLVGEIERIGSVSPDGRYVLVQMGDNAQLAHLRYCCGSPLIDSGEVWMMLFDVEADPANNVVPEATFYFTEAGYYVDSRWIDNQTVFLQTQDAWKPVQVDEEGFYYPVAQSGYRLIKINERNIPTTINVYGYWDEISPLSPNGRYMQFQQGVMNTETLIYTPLIHEEASGYFYQYVWEEDRLIISIRTTLDTTEAPEASYRVKIP